MSKLVNKLGTRGHDPSAQIAAQSAAEHVQAFTATQPSTAADVDISTSTTHMLAQSVSRTVLALLLLLLHCML
jgi:hypothetical protein